MKSHTDFAKYDDEKLIRLITQLREEALAQLYDRYNRLVFSLALAIVSDRATAEEITLDVFMRVWQKAEFLPFRSGQGQHMAHPYCRVTTPSMSCAAGRSGQTSMRLIGKMPSLIMCPRNTTRRNLQNYPSSASGFRPRSPNCPRIKDKL